MDIPLDGEDIKLLNEAHVYVGAAFHGLLKRRTGLLQAANEDVRADVNMDVARAGLVFIEEAEIKLRAINEDVRRKPVLTDKHQQTVRELQPIMEQLMVLVPDIQTESVNALGNKMLGDHKMDRLKHDSFANISGARSTLERMLKKIIAKMDAIGSIKINDSPGSVRGV